MIIENNSIICLECNNKLLFGNHTIHTCICNINYFKEDNYIYAITISNELFRLIIYTEFNKTKPNHIKLLDHHHSSIVFTTDYKISSNTKLSTLLDKFTKLYLFL